MSNPLSKFFRQPALYIELPSRGRHWPPGTLELNENGQLAVYPMTARDELTLKTPDALLNGQAVVDVLKSCIPQIKDPWRMPAMDSDFLLIAIRIASYGEKMSFDSSCPKCSETSSYEMYLPDVMDKIQAPNFDQPLNLGEIEIYLKPQTYKETNDAGMRMYQEQRLLNTVNDSNMSQDEKVRRFNDIFKDLTAINLASVASHVKTVLTPDGEVTDPKFIAELLDNVPKKVWQRVEEFIKEVGKQGKLPDNNVECDSCKHAYTLPIEFDYATFFE